MYMIEASAWKALKEVVAISDRKHNAWDKTHAAIAKAEAAQGNSERIVSEALCRNHLSGFTQPCAGVCSNTVPGQPHPCEHAVTVHGSDAQEILRALESDL